MSNFIKSKNLDKNSILKSVYGGMREILFIMIGVFLALAANNWNEGRIEREHELDYLELILRDLQADSTNLDSLVNFSNEVVRSKKILQDYQSGKIEKPDSLSLHFLRQTFSGVKRFTYNKGAIEEIQSAGGLSLFKNEDLRGQILDLYNLYEYEEKNVGQFYQEQLRISREVIYSKADRKFFITTEETDQELLHELVMDPTIQNRILNNWVRSRNSSLKKLAAHNEQTIENCRAYIKTFN